MIRQSGIIGYSMHAKVTTHSLVDHRQQRTENNEILHETKIPIQKEYASGPGKLVTPSKMNLAVEGDEILEHKDHCTTTLSITGA